MDISLVRPIGEVRQYREPYQEQTNIVPGSPIYITWDQVIDGMPEALEVAAQAVRDLQVYTPRKLSVEFRGTSWSDGDWGSTEWYTQKCKLPNGQVEADDLIALYHSEPWQETPHVDLVLLGEDITTRGHNFLFGAARGRVTIQSLRRYLDSRLDPAMLASMTHWVVAHELGHVLGLVPSTAPNHDPQGAPGSLYYWHCGNLCYMKQVVSVEELRQRVLDLSGRPIFCPACQQILAAG